MAFVHGKSTAVYLGAVDLSGFLNNVDLSGDADPADTTTFGSTWKDALIGVIGGSVGFSGFYDADNTLADTLAALTPGVLTYCPGGAAAIGDRARLVSAYTVTYQESVPVGGVVAISGSFSADGTVGFGDVLHVLGEDTNTTTGSSRDDTAETDTGWIAHLHVTAVDGGSWVVKLQDSDNDSTWADVTGGAFTAATAETAERLTSAAGATLRQYVRYVATRTGGSAGDGITFMLAYSRQS